MLFKIRHSTCTNKYILTCTYDSKSSTNVVLTRDELVKLEEIVSDKIFEIDNTGQTRREHCDSSLNDIRLKKAE
jgi:hypothetical protein